jgi:hypothetical protein
MNALRSFFGIAVLVSALFVVPSITAQESAPDTSRRVYAGIDTGYWAGLGGAAQFSVLELTDQLPIGLHAHVGFFYVFDPGNAEDARQVFINDNQGGTVEKWGRNIIIGVDVSYLIVETDEFELMALAGPRFTSFSGEFEFVGDNENFDVTSNQWGGGVGAALDLAIAPRMIVRFIAGLDYFFPSKLEGHGEYSYTPDGVDDNPRDSYKWADADKAINQPALTPRAAVGVHFQLNG